jgi:hypothetical protein
MWGSWVGRTLDDDSIVAVCHLKSETWKIFSSCKFEETEILNREVILGMQNAHVKIITWLEYLAQKDKQWVMYRRRACTQVLFLREAELGFSLFRNSDRYLQLVRISRYSLAGTFHRRRSRSLKTGFFGQVRELKIRRKNPGSALRTCSTRWGTSLKANMQANQIYLNLLFLYVLKLLENSWNSHFRWTKKTFLS